jgi:drug/metabolite transporter (DMT)-like permease
MTDTLRGCLWMSGAVLSFSLMAISGRFASLDLDTFEILLYRSILGIMIVVTGAKLAGTLSQISTRRLHLHGIRNLCHFTGQGLWFYSITLIPLAQVFALEFTVPFWAMAGSALILGERLTRNRIAATLAGFVGILIVTRPNPDTLEFGQLTAALAAIGFAGSAVFTRLLTRTETITCIMFWLTVLQAGFGLICAGYDGDIALPAPQSWRWVVLIAIGGIVAHFCLTKALSLAPASVVIPIDFARLPIIALAGMLIFNETLELWVFVGAAIIFMANYLNIRYENRRI